MSEIQTVSPPWNYDDPQQRRAARAVLNEWQKGECAGCAGGRWRHGSRQLFVDHDHETGSVRGLLCGSCNGGLGRADAHIRWGDPAAEWWVAFRAVTPAMAYAGGATFDDWASGRIAECNYLTGLLRRGPAPDSWGMIDWEYSTDATLHIRAIAVPVDADDFAVRCLIGFGRMTNDRCQSERTLHLPDGSTTVLRCDRTPELPMAQPHRHLHLVLPGDALSSDLADQISDLGHGRIFLEWRGFRRYDPVRDNAMRGVF